MTRIARAICLSMTRLVSVFLLLTPPEFAQSSKPDLRAFQSAESSLAAMQDFAEAKALCEADSGKLWGISLCGPILLVDPETRALIASERDAEGALMPSDRVYIGTLPRSETFANTAVEWSGTHWTEMMLRLPVDRSQRDTLTLHELFHRVQNELPFAPMRSASNAYLDTLEGRYTMLLEYRALARALSATKEQERRAAIADALLFRIDRYHVFQNAHDDEKALEMNEGLAEYTGVRLGNPDPSEARSAALRDFQTQAGIPSLVRSFAYATGPGYGLLLDIYQPDWRTRLSEGQTPAELLQSALKISTPADPSSSIERASAQYDGASLFSAESERERKRQERLKQYRAAFIDGPILTIPLRKMSVQFDPRTLQPLDEVGTVYPPFEFPTFGVSSMSRRAL